jgi:hypothetical protein
MQVRSRRVHADIVRQLEQKTSDHDDAVKQVPCAAPSCARAPLTITQLRECQRESAENKRRCDTWSQTVAKLQEDGEQMLRALRKAEQREQEAAAAEKKTQQARRSHSFGDEL